MKNEEFVHIEGTVENILFKNVSNGYIVLDLDMGTALTTVVGELGDIEEGEELCLTGQYITHSKFGVQFKAVICERKLPETAYAIQKYLSSGAIKGIGPTIAKRIVDEFGERSLMILENSPDELIKVKGITLKKIDEISQELRRIFGIRKLMNYLSQYNISPSSSVKAWKKWGQFSLDIINENPYSLCDDEIELDFFKAEEIAQKLEISDNDKNRIRAGMRYILSENLFSGHTCLPTDKLLQKSKEILGISEEDFYKTLEQEYLEENLIEYMKKNRSFTFLRDYYIAESYISGRMAVMQSFFLDSKTDYEKMISEEEKNKNITYDDVQKKAISLALSKGFIILTGGPGTGKTTTLKAIISLYERQGKRVMLAAPTGRAAKRISDLTGYEAKTIHRLLEMGYSDGQLRFIHNENNPIECDVLIVDEMSMVDTLLFEALLRAMKLNCRIIMVGDSDQLPSVGAGNILKDLIDSGTMTVVKLEKIFRQAQQSCIVTNAHKIVSGEMPDLSQKNNDFFFLKAVDEDDAIRIILQLYLNRLPKAYNISPTEDIQILSPSRKGKSGVVELNRLIQSQINPSSSQKNEIKSMLYTFREKDKVMQIKNNYDIVWTKGDEPGTGVFNGDIGTILLVKKSEGTVVIDFEGRIAEYSTELLNQLELAYAVTVHKSQGSEFPYVIIPIIDGFDKLYFRNLLYTAVTRAKQMIIIVGSEDRIRYMVENNRKTLRYSCLKSFLKTELKNEQADENNN